MPYAIVPACITLACTYGALQPGMSFFAFPAFVFLCVTVLFVFASRADHDNG